jgi:hypothetical protein
MNSRAAASGPGCVCLPIPQRPQAAALRASPFTPCPLIGQAHGRARSPGTDRHGHLFANRPQRLGVWHGEGEQLDEAAVVEALDLKDRASRDDLAGFLLTPPPRVVTARITPVSVSITSPRLGPGRCRSGSAPLRMASETAASMKARLLRSRKLQHSSSAAYSCGGDLGAHLAHFGMLLPACRSGRKGRSEALCFRT